jgi:D-alanine-D-alanine ligase
MIWLGWRGLGIVGCSEWSNLPDFKVALLYNEPVSLDGKPDEVDVLDQVDGVIKSFSKLGIMHCVIPVSGRIESVFDALDSHRPDVVFNLCESVNGCSGFEMNIPSVLELLRIPYTGSTPLTLGLCQRKDLTKAVLESNGIPTPRYCVMTDGRDDFPHDLRFPLIVKPVHEDGSIGITGQSIVANRPDLRNRVNQVARTYGEPALVEEYIDGRELNVAILGNDPPTVLPISEICFTGKGRVVSYGAKWVASSKMFVDTPALCPAELDAKTQKRVEELSLSSYGLLGCRDYARIDFRLKDDVPFILEINPNPDIAPDAGFARSLRAAGLGLEDFVEKVVGLALGRGRLSSS